jgi:hypothetical protein
MYTSGMKPLFGLIIKMNATAKVTGSRQSSVMHCDNVTVQVASAICGIITICVMTSVDFVLFFFGFWRRFGLLWFKGRRSWGCYLLEL